MKKRLSIILFSLLLVTTFLTGCQSQKTNETPAEDQTGNENEGTPAEGTENVSDEKKTIVIGATPAPHGDILNAAKEILAEEGYELEIKEFVDYVQPNLALSSDQLDANFFQHEPYLIQFNQERNTNLVSAGFTHYEPFAIYPGNTASLEELKEGAQIAVPNDATNEARALLLLEAQGLIKLKQDVGVNATKNDIVENPNNYKIIEMEAAQLPRALSDVDIAVINGNFALSAGLNVDTDALAAEDTESVGATTYKNVIAVKAGNENNPEIQALMKALQSDTIRDFINEKYKGAVVPLF